MATIPETKNETSPQKSAAEAKNDNAACAAEKCDLKQQENNEGRESAENLKNQSKDASAGDKKSAVNSSEATNEDDQNDEDSEAAAAAAQGEPTRQDAEKNGEQKSSSPKKEAHKKPLDQNNDESAEDDQDEEAGEPESKKRRTLPSEETNELADKGKVGVSDNGPAPEEVEELKNGSAKN